MIVFTANGRCAKIKADEPITTGSVGMPVSVVLSGDFDGLAAIMVFACGDVSADVALMGQEVTVPPQVLEEAGRVLEIGVYGARADGTIVIPTVWAKACIVHEGVLPSGVDPAEPTPSWAAQVQQWAEDAHDTAEQLAQDVENWEAEINTAIENARDATQDATQTAASIAQAESSRVTAEQARASAESSRAAAESARVTAEASRATAEQSRTAAESSRAEAEQSRVTAETARTTAESARATAEQGRVTAEQSRATAETARASAESVRVTAEQGRASAENARASAESARVTAESARASAETSRANAETARSNAELARASEWATIKAEAEDATDAAESAASDATAAAAEARAASAATWLSGNVLFGELAEAAVLTADDAYSAPPKGVEVFGKSTQAGTPTPDAPQEIKSVDDLTLVFAGKNLFDATTWIDDGRIPSANTGKLVSSTVSHRSALVQLNVGTYTYSLVNGYASGPKYVHAYDSNGTWLRTLVAANAGAVGTTFSASFEVASEVACVCIVAQIADTNVQLELGSTATTYAPYVGQSVEIPLSNHIARSLPNGTRDTLTLSYIGPSTEHEGWGVFAMTLQQLIGSTTTAATDGITGIIGVDVLSTTGEITDGPTVIYKLPTPVTHDLGTVELPILPNPLTAWADGGSAQPTMQLEYERALSIVIPRIEDAIADMATS